MARAREEKEAEERRRREEEEAGNRFVDNLARATQADLFVLDEVTGVLTVVHDGGIGLDHDGRDGNISATEWALRTDSPRLPKVRLKDLPLLRHVTALESVTNFITGRNLVEERNRLRTFEQIPAGKGTDSTDPNTHYANEQIRAHADVHGLWSGSDASFALLAALFPAWNVGYEVALAVLNDLSGVKFRDATDEKVAEAKRAYLEQQARFRESGEVKGVTPHEYKAFLEESLATIERNARATVRRRTPEQIEKFLKRAYAGPGARWTPGSLRRPAPAEWLNRYFAEEPTLDPLADKYPRPVPRLVRGAPARPRRRFRGQARRGWRGREPDVAPPRRSPDEIPWLHEEADPHRRKKVRAWTRAEDTSEEATPEQVTGEAADESEVE